MNGRYETNDNFALVPVSPGTVNTLYLTGAIDASKQLENSVTRLKSDVSAVRQRGVGAQNRIDGQLALTQALTDPLNTFNFAFQYAQDFNNVIRTADVTQSPGRRRTANVSAIWSRFISERLSGNVQFSLDRTSYGAQLPGAVGYRDAAGSAGLSYRVSETASLSLQASHSEYRAADDVNRSKTDSVNLSLSRPISDRASGSLAIGVYRTASAARSLRLVCPLESPLCDAGLVSPVLVERPNDTARNGLQFNGSYRWRLDETTESLFSIARQQAPSGAGALVRSDTLSLGLNRSFSDTLAGSVNYVRSRSALQDALNGQSSGRSALGVSLAKRLAPNLSLQTSYQHSRSDATVFASGARSNSFSVSLAYDGPPIDVSR